MRKALWTTIVLAGLCLIPEGASACGDKFIVLGRGVRFQTVHAAANPAFILLYMNPDSRLPIAERAYQLQATLRLAGHKPAAVETPGEVAAALNSKSYDLVLGDIADAEALDQAMAGATSRPMFVPVLYEPSPEEIETAKKDYGCLMQGKSKRRGSSVLLAIDSAMEARKKGAVCGPAK
jgi:hypothetical protein